MKKILILLCGMSPAVITETIYAMQDDLPDRIVVLTTTEGKKCIVDELFGQLKWVELLNFLNHKIDFYNNQNSIRVFPAENSDNNDILNSSDAVLAMNFIIENLRQFTECSDTKIVFSISGGRKTMSVLGALAMSFIGRKTDKLCHIVASKPFDQPDLKPKFYFPQVGVIHNLPDGSTFLSEDAILEFCSIPFVRQRYLFEQRFQLLPVDYLTMIDEANNLAGDESIPHITAEISELTFCINDAVIKLPKLDFFCYLMLLKHKKNNLPPLRGTMPLYENLYDFIAEQKYSNDLINKLKNIDHSVLRKTVCRIAKKLNTIPAGQKLLPSLRRGVYAVAGEFSMDVRGTSTP